MAVISINAAIGESELRPPHPLLRATAWSSMIGLAAGLVLGLVTQLNEHDGG